MRERETGPANSPFHLNLEDGIHTYAVYAEDKAGNKTPRLSRRVAFLDSPSWRIKPRNPAGDIVLNIPPSAPGLDFKPRLNVEFSVENLPDNNPSLIKEALIINNTTGESVARRNLTQVDVDGEVELDRKRPNTITIQVRDVNDVLKTRQFNVHVK